MESSLSRRRLLGAPCKPALHWARSSPRPDDARVFELQQQAAATQRERDSLERRLTDLERARSEADAQADAYRIGRVHQDELRVEQAQADLASAMAREADAVAAARRGDALH